MALSTEQQQNLSYLARTFQEQGQAKATAEAQRLGMFKLYSDTVLSGTNASINNLAYGKFASTAPGGVSFDPFLRDAEGRPIGTALPPAGSTPESIRRSQEAARSASVGGSQLLLSREEALRQDVAARQTTSREQPQTKQGFSGRVEVLSKTGEPEETRFLVGGRQVAVRRGQTFEPSLRRGEKARLTFDREGTRQEVEIFEGELIEREFQFRQRSATDLVLGGGTQDHPQDLNMSVTEQADLEAQQDQINLGGLFVTGREIGQEDGVFEVQPRTGGFISRVKQRVGEVGGEADWFDVAVAIGKESRVAFSSPISKTKEFLEPQLFELKIATGLAVAGASEIAKTKQYQAFREFSAPREQAVISSKEYQILSRVTIAGLAFSPRGIVERAVPKPIEYKMTTTRTRVRVTESEDVIVPISKSSDFLSEKLLFDQMSLTRIKSEFVKRQVGKGGKKIIYRGAITDPLKKLQKLPEPKPPIPELPQKPLDPFIDIPEWKTQIEARELTSNFIVSKLPKSRRTPLSRTFPPELTDLQKISLKRYQTKQPSRVDMLKPKKIDSRIKIIKDVSVPKEVKTSTGQSLIQEQVVKQKVVELELTTPEQLAKEQKALQKEINKLLGGKKKRQRFVEEELPEEQFKFITRTRFSEIESQGERIIFPSRVPLIDFSQDKTITKEFQKVMQQDIVKEKVLTKQFNIVKDIQVGKQRGRQRVVFIQPQIETQLQKQPQLFKQPQINILKTIQPEVIKQFRLRERTRERFRLRERTREQEKSKPFRPFRLKPYKQPRQSLGSFITLVRRGGVFRPVFKGEFTQAYAKGIFVTQRTLARSFRVVDPFGRLVKTGLPSGFRRPRGKKRDEFTIIEKGKFALDQPSEVAEIQSYIKQSARRR